MNRLLFPFTSARILVLAVVNLLLGFSARAAEPISHSFSGFAFPATVASFQRAKVTRFDKEGKYLGVGYNDRNARAAITIFVYPAPTPYSPGALRKHFNDCRQELFKAHGRVHTALEHATKPRGKYHGFGGIYSYRDVSAGQKQAMVSWLTVYQKENVIVKFWETYPDATADASAQAIGKFKETFVWPK